jgi:hypothetical protein
MTEPEWKQLEILIAKIQQELAPSATVSHNVKLLGRHSKTHRQIDVLVQQRIGQYEMRIIIDCKDHASPIDVNGVGEFLAVINDVGAQKGAMVCPRGFTEAAKNFAKTSQIDLYSPIDTDPHKWQVKPTVPMLCDFRGMKIAFGISVSAPVPFTMPYDFYSHMIVYDEKGNQLGTPEEVALKRWEAGELPIEPGEHNDIPNFPEAVTYADNGYGMRIPVTLTISLGVYQELYYGQLPLIKIRGLKDEHTGKVITNAFTTGGLNPEEVQKNWLRLEPGQAPPLPPLLTARGLYCWGVE